MRVFTIAGGEVTLGALVESFTLSGAGVTIPAILVGESGRGRSLGVLPVHLTPSFHSEWKEKGQVMVSLGTVGQTKSGRPKLFPEADPDDSRCLVVLRTPIGFRGSNNHTGDRSGREFRLVYEALSAALGLPKAARQQATRKDITSFTWYSQAEASALAEAVAMPLEECFESRSAFAPFPGEVLVEGQIAQGAAGRMGSGQQLVAVIPRGVVFRTSYGGRLYGRPPEHYYRFDMERIEVATWQERQVADLW